MTDDQNAQVDEIQSVESIFGDLIHLESPTSLTVQFNSDVKISINLPKNYPERSPPYFELSGPSLTDVQKRDLKNTLNEIYLRNIGMPVLYEWIHFLRDYLEELYCETVTDELICDSVGSTAALIDHSMETAAKVPRIISGKTLTDRKSTFQSHVAQVFCKNEVELVLNKLKENGKIARATHNMYAWLTENHTSGRVIKHHDCEDDGETGAGAKLLNLLEMMKAKNVLVVVTRWYGGIHLGPDRFRHICNSAREILVENGFSNRS